MKIRIRVVWDGICFVRSADTSHTVRVLLRDIRAQLMERFPQDPRIRQINTLSLRFDDGDFEFLADEPLEILEKDIVVVATISDQAPPYCPPAQPSARGMAPSFAAPMQFPSATANIHRPVHQHSAATTHTIKQMYQHLHPYWSQGIVGYREFDTCIQSLRVAFPGVSPQALGFPNSVKLVEYLHSQFMARNTTGHPKPQLESKQRAAEDIPGAPGAKEAQPQPIDKRSYLEELASNYVTSQEIVRRLQPSVTDPAINASALPRFVRMTAEQIEKERKVDAAKTAVKPQQSKSEDQPAQPNPLPANKEQPPPPRPRSAELSPARPSLRPVKPPKPRQSPTAMDIANFLVHFVDSSGGQVSSTAVREELRKQFPSTNLADEFAKPRVFLDTYARKKLIYFNPRDQAKDGPPLVLAVNAFHQAFEAIQNSIRMYLHAKSRVALAILHTHLEDEHLFLRSAAGYSFFNVANLRETIERLGSGYEIVNGFVQLCGSHFQPGKVPVLRSPKTKNQKQPSKSPQRVPPPSGAPATQIPGAAVESQAHTTPPRIAAPRQPESEVRHYTAAETVLDTLASVEDAIRSMVTSYYNSGRRMVLLSQISRQIKEIFPQFSPVHFGFPNLFTYLNSLSDIGFKDNRKNPTDVYVIWTLADYGEPIPVRDFLPHAEEHHLSKRKRRKNQNNGDEIEMPTTPSSDDDDEEPQLAEPAPASQPPPAQLEYSEPKHESPLIRFPDAKKANGNGQQVPSSEFSESKTEEPKLSVSALQLFLDGLMDRVNAEEGIELSKLDRRVRNEFSSVDDPYYETNFVNVKQVLVDLGYPLIPNHTYSKRFLTNVETFVFPRDVDLHPRLNKRWKYYDAIDVTGEMNAEEVRDVVQFGMQDEESANFLFENGVSGERLLSMHPSDFRAIGIDLNDDFVDGVLNVFYYPLKHGLELCNQLRSVPNARLKDLFIPFNLDLGAFPGRKPVLSLLCDNIDQVPNLKWLLKHHRHLNVNYQEQHKLFGALHYAAWAANCEAVQALVSAGADTAIRNKEGETPLDSALHKGSRNGPKKKNLVEFLKSLGGVEDLNASVVSNQSES